MRDLIRAVTQLAADHEFTAFQNDLVRHAYQALGQGYSSNENEVQLVTGLVKSLRGNSHGPLSVFADKIHGTASWVEFDYMDKPTTKELGDMAVITTVTRQRERLFQRLCVIQNKKRGPTGWAVDQEQLYLLKNFPPFAGNKGIFKNCRDVAFRNESGCLGAYGLLHARGEMVFASGPLVAELLRGRKSLPESDVALVEATIGPFSHQVGGAFPFGGPSCRIHPREWFHLCEMFAHEFGWPFLFGHGVGRWLGNAVFGRDLYDFVRLWTQLNIGEVTYAFGEVANAPVDAFANVLLRRIGLGDVFDMPSDQFAELEFESEMGILALHFDVGRME